jgi:hypothetical protein
VRQGRGVAKVVALLALAAVLFGATASLVKAELTASGNLFITFDGGILPEALPRDARAPITVWISGQVRTLSGETPPSLRQVTIGLNRDGRLDTRGLPTCAKAEIDLASSTEALAACGDALVGTGKYRARTKFPEQSQSPSHGRILAFNTTIGGKPAILGHVYGKQPAPSTGIVVFHITHPRGTFGTVLTGTMPETLTRWGYLKRNSLKQHRNYTYKGSPHSYLSAPCHAPSDLNQASFQFAYASMAFDDGRTLSSKLTRTCRVKRETRR